MTYFPKIGIYGADSPSIDAFARWRTSETYTIFDSKLIYDSGSLFWDISGSGGGTSAYSASHSSVYLQVPAAAGARVVRQTKQWFNYQPGKSQLVVLTTASPPEDGITKRLGYFNDNDGLYWEASGSEIYVVKRSSTTGTVVDTKISQSNWNLDTADGSGASGTNMDWTKAQIFFVDFEWLGVGRVRFGHFYGGVPFYTHEFSHENDLSNVYIQTPNLPLRYEIINDAGTQAGSLQSICASVMSEGGLQEAGVYLAVDTNGAERSIPNDATGSLVAVRLKDTHLGATVEPENVSVMSTGGAEVYWTLRLNPTSGSDAFLWEDVPNSPLQRATNFADVNIKGGIQLASGGVAGASAINVRLRNLIKLGSKVDGTRDILVLGAKSLGGGADTTAALELKIIQ